MDQVKRRGDLYNLLGYLPSRDREITVKTVFMEERESFVLEKLILDLNGTEPVPAYFLRPKNVTGKLPVVLYNHSHGGRYHMGKDELLEGAPYMLPYGEVLAKRGIASFCIDAWGFGERSGKTETSLFKSMLWKGQVMWGMMVYDNLRALDYLHTRSDIDPNRIATLGMSMGSTMAWWTAALDIRIKVTVDICCLTDYQALMEEDGLDGHGIYYYVPDLLNHFTTSEINALISPRAHLGLAGTQDPLTPLSGLHKIDQELKQVYRNMNAEDAWKLLLYDVGHVETEEMRTAVLNFLDENL